MRQDSETSIIVLNTALKYKILYIYIFIHHNGSENKKSK